MGLHFIKLDIVSLIWNNHKQVIQKKYDCNQISKINCFLFKYYSFLLKLTTMELFKADTSSVQV